MSSDVFHYSPYQDRVIEEKKELDIKIEKLDKFLDLTAASICTEEEIQHLQIQLPIMRLYSSILELRISKFTH